MHRLLVNGEVAFLCGLVVTLWTFVPNSLMLVFFVTLQSLQTDRADITFVTLIFDAFMLILNMHFQMSISGCRVITNITFDQFALVFCFYMHIKRIFCSVVFTKFTFYFDTNMYISFMPV